MNALPWIVVVLVILIAVWYINKTQTAQKTIAEANIAEVVANTPPIIVNNAPICVPFTQANQDYEKAHKIIAAHCDIKALTPIVGPKLFADCIKKVTESLTPVNNCQ